jgi:peptide chain release factor 1
MRTLAAEEIDTVSTTLVEMIEKDFPILLIPPSKTTHFGALMELKSGVGGSESSLFLAELLRMYQRLASNNGWCANVVSKNDLEGGGIKDAVLELKGEGVYDSLRWESGVHRVQRVPATESSGRTHTSTVAVIVRETPLASFQFSNLTIGPSLDGRI